MNGPEFFMRNAGYRLLPPELATGDPVADADALFSISLPQSTGKTLRLSSCWMVITPSGVATSFKVVPEAGFKTDEERKVSIKSALKGSEPCMLLALGKRTMKAADLFVTYDPRAARLCSQGDTKTFDATKDIGWTS
jgi:hypothetical protein